MSQQTRSVNEREEGLRLFLLAVVAGIAAGLTRPIAAAAFTDVGIVPVELHHGVLSTLALGLHFVYSVGFGGAFVAALAWIAPRRLRAAPWRVTLLGVGYGLVLWLVNVAVGWPLVQAAMGLGGGEIPHLHAGPLVVHGLYGLVLGLVVAAAWH